VDSRRVAELLLAHRTARQFSPGLWAATRAETNLAYLFLLTEMRR